MVVVVVVVVVVGVVLLKDISEALMCTITWLDVDPSRAATALTAWVQVPNNHILSKILTDITTIQNPST